MDQYQMIKKETTEFSDMSLLYYELNMSFQTFEADTSESLVYCQELFSAYYNARNTSLLYLELLLCGYNRNVCQHRVRRTTPKTTPKPTPRIRRDHKTNTPSIE